MSVRTVRGLAAVALLLAGGTGCSALSGQNDSDKSFSAAPSRPAPSSSAPAHQARYSASQPVAAVLRDTRRDLGDVLSLDYRHLGHGRTAALAASSGDYADTVRAQYSPAARAALRQSRQTQDPQVVKVGIAGLTDRNRRAYAYARVTVNTSVKDQTPTSRSVDVSATLGLDGDRWRISALSYSGFPKGPLPGNADLRAAAKGAGAAIARLYTFTRGSAFDTVFRSALDLQTGKLRYQSELQRQNTKAAVDKLSYDQKASAAGVAAEKIDADGRPTFLVHVKQYRVLSRTKTIGPYPVVVEVQVTWVDGRWLLSSADQLQ